MNQWPKEAIQDFANLAASLLESLDANTAPTAICLAPENKDKLGKYDCCPKHKLMRDIHETLTLRAKILENQYSNFHYTNWMADISVKYGKIQPLSGYWWKRLAELSGIDLPERLQMFSY